MSSNDPLLNNQLVEQLVNSNPELLRLLVEINQKRQQNQLLEFMRRQQQIMQEELVTQKMPSLKENIDNMRRKISIKQGMIEQTKQLIEKTKYDIEGMKKRIAAKYEQKRANQQYQRLLQNKANMLRQSRKASGSKNKNMASAIKKQSQEQIIENICKIRNNLINQTTQSNEYTNNKQNLNTINTITKTQNKPENMPQNSSFKIIKLKTDNTIMETKISSLKEQIKKKQKMLDQTKKQRKRKQNNEEEDIVNSKTKYMTSRRSNSLMRSEFVSVEESENENSQMIRGDTNSMNKQGGLLQQQQIIPDRIYQS